MRTNSPGPRLTRMFLMTRIGDVFLGLCLISLVWQHFAGSSERHTTARTPLRPHLQTDMTLKIREVEWKVARNVVLYMATTCPACNDSVTFYEALSRSARAYPDASFVVLSKEPVDVVGEWLSSHGITHDAVVQIAQPQIVGLMFTPTLLIVDNSARVTDMMVAKLSPDDEGQVLSRVAGTLVDPISNYAKVFAEEIDAIRFGQLASETPLVLDVRERDQYSRAHKNPSLNIPLDELETRAPRELSARERIVVDCTNLDLVQCRLAGLRLRGFGFERVSLLLERMYRTR